MSEVFQLFECGDVFQFTDSADSYQTWQGLRGPKGDPGEPGPKGDPGEVTQAEFDALADEVADQKSALDDLTALVDRKAGMLVDTASGAIASFVPDATIPDLLGVTVDVEPVQTGSGDPSPTNIRPISGFSSAHVYVSPTQDAQDATVYAIDLDGTRYGGTLDVTGGTMLVDKVCVDLGTITWVAHASLSNVYTGNGRNLPRWFVRDGAVANAICSAYVITTSASGGVDAIDFSIAMGTDSSTNIYVHDSHVSDISEFVTAINGVQLVYEIKNPIEITLDPVTIAAIAGQTNNVWADAGTVDVDYCADTKLYIADVLSELCYSKGEYVEIDTACYGVITSSKKRAEINIVLPKRLPSNATINVTYLHSYLFLPDGSRIGGAANYDLLANATIAIRRADTVLLIWATSSTDLGNIDNVPISGGVVCRFTIN